MHRSKSEVLQKKVLTKMAEQWRGAAIIFGVLLTGAWLALLAWLLLKLV
jgi:hypothetical protein